MVNEHDINDMKPATSSQVGGDHYSTLGTFQPWVVLQHWLTPEEYRGWLKGDAITYLARERAKNGFEDIQKASHTLAQLVETEMSKGNK